MGDVDDTMIYAFILQVIESLTQDLAAIDS